MLFLIFLNKLKLEKSKECISLYGKFEKTSFDSAIILMSEYLIPAVDINHFMAFVGKEESCFILFPNLSSATAPINFPSIKRHADESE
jgi:hypothetical protein